MSSFAITAATAQVTLDQAGTAQVSFTVANTSAQSVRARVVTKPLAPARSEWLSVIGKPVRDLSAGAAEQVIVRLGVRPDTPKGPYSFRLDAVSETAPDEDFAEGPAVAFSVAAPQSKKRFPWWIPRRDRARRRHR
jgi:hypothetical protein